jgi:hypothetical protein
MKEAPPPTPPTPPETSRASDNDRDTHRRLIEASKRAIERRRKLLKSFEDAKPPPDKGKS